LENDDVIGMAREQASSGRLAADWTSSFVEVLERLDDDLLLLPLVPDWLPLLEELGWELRLT